MTMNSWEWATQLSEYPVPEVLRPMIERGSITHAHIVQAKTPLRVKGLLSLGVSLMDRRDEEEEVSKLLYGFGWRFRRGRGWADPELTQTGSATYRLLEDREQWGDLW